MQSKHYSSESQIFTEEEQDNNISKQQNDNYQRQKQEKTTKVLKSKKNPHIVQFLHTKINLKKIIINISNTQYPVISQVADQLQWKIQTKSDAHDWDVYWTDSAILPEILFKMHFFQKISHYPGIHIIARKNLLGLNLMGMRQRYSQQYNFFPMTWILPSQYSEFRQYYESVKKGKKKIYIVKPEAQSQGKGIFLTRNIQELTNGRRYVVQKYISKPFLIDQLKFDFRIYVLLAGTEPLRIYLYEQGLVRFATQPYKEPNPNNLNDMCMHLTNYAINKFNPKFVFNTTQKNMNVGHKRALTAVFKFLEKKGYDILALKAKIKDLIIKTFLTGIPLINHQYKYCQPQQYSGNMCFHILGFDILLTQQFQPVLLEVNHTPSFTTDTPLDNFIKHKLIKDTLILMNVNPQSKVKLFQKAKDCNAQRLFTGKRRIYQGVQKQQEILRAQKQRDQYEQKNMGGFQKIHPVKNDKLTRKYEILLQYSKKVYLEENTLRSRVMKQQILTVKNDTQLQKSFEKQITTESQNNFSVQMSGQKLNPRRGKSAKTQLKKSSKKRQEFYKEKPEFFKEQFEDIQIKTVKQQKKQTQKQVLLTTSSKFKSRVISAFAYSTQNYPIHNIFNYQKEDQKIFKSVFYRPSSTSRKKEILPQKMLEKQKQKQKQKQEIFRRQQKLSKNKLGNFIKPKLYDISDQKQSIKNKTIILSMKYPNSKISRKIPYIINKKDTYPYNYNE